MTVLVGIIAFWAGAVLGCVLTIAYYPHIVADAPEDYDL